MNVVDVIVIAQCYENYGPADGPANWKAKGSAEFSMPLSEKWLHQVTPTNLKRAIEKLLETEVSDGFTKFTYLNHSMSWEPRRVIHGLDELCEEHYIPWTGEAEIPASDDMR